MFQVFGGHTLEAYAMFRGTPSKTVGVFILPIPVFQFRRRLVGRFTGFGFYPGLHLDPEFALSDSACRKRPQFRRRFLRKVAERRILCGHSRYPLAHVQVFHRPLMLPSNLGAWGDAALCFKVANQISRGPLHVSGAEGVVAGWVASVVAVLQLTFNV
jgi:hypothetical protein